MTTAAANETTRATAPRWALGGDDFVATGILVRFMLRRDRVRLPAWVAGLALYWLYCTRGVPTAYAEDELDGLAATLSGPMSRLLVGPAHGFDDLAFDRLLTGGYGLYAILLAALMGLLVVIRHTRLEEQSGRAELVRANVVGRHAGLTAAVTMAVISSVAVAAAVFVVSISSPHLGTAGSVLFSASLAAAGMAFAGLAAVTAQLSAFSRTAAGLAGGGLGAAFVLRALGDMTAMGGSVLSWLSPLGWSQQTAPFVLDRWWPLLLSLGFFAATTGAGFALSIRRDLGAGMVSVKPGRSHAAPWLGSPLALALRLQVSAILGWSAALIVSGALFGGWIDALLGSVDDLPETILELMGGVDNVVAGYLGVMAMSMAILVAVYCILAVQGLRNEETIGRAEPVLATAVSRHAWLGTYLAVAAVAAVVILGLTGVATGLGAVIVTGEGGHVVDLLLAHLYFAPPVLLVVAVAALLFGVAPRLIGLSWIIVVYATVVGFFGELLNLPSWLHNLSPFGHVGHHPLEPVAALPLLIMTAMAMVVGAMSLVAIRRRDINVA